MWCHVGEQFADVNVVDGVAHGNGGIMVWAGVCYKPQAQVHFSDGILNAQRYRKDPEAFDCCGIHPRPSVYVAA